MKLHLLQILSCPVCAGELLLTRVEKEDASGEVLEGELGCEAGHFYPLIGGIPRLLSGELLRETLECYHPEHFARYRDRLGEQSGENSVLKKQTLRSFSYQWNVFSQMYSHWEENFRSYFAPLLSPASFAGKRVLDAGCGFGRHAFYAGKYGAEVVAMDLSEAVEAAYANTRHLPQVHVIQGDIYAPPLRPVFDLIYCVGVIQHLPAPEKGFCQLATLLRERAAIFAWVYGRRRGVYRLVDFMRHFSTRMSMRSLYWVSFALNLLSFLFFSLPYRILRQLPGGKRLAGAWPFTRYADLPLRVGQADWFDRLAVPSTVYFSREEVEGWYAKAGLDQVEVQSREGIGWRALGWRQGCREVVGA